MLPDPPKPPLSPAAALQDRLRRLQEALPENHSLSRREARRAKKELRRAERRAREDATRNPLLGVIYALGALVTLGIVVRMPQMWWLIFIAVFVFGQKAARHLMPGHSPGSRQAAPLPQQARSAAADADPRLARVDALCGKLMAELRSGPAVLREVVHSPEQTVEALRKSCHELARREHELRALCSPEDERRLAEEHSTLASRVETEKDSVVRERLASALKVLEQQQRQRAELSTAASRLEAEHTRLYYTLENLYTQVMRARTADSASEDVAGLGLRQSVEQLGTEMEAVTEALEDVHRPGGSRIPTR